MLTIVFVDQMPYVVTQISRDYANTPFDWGKNFDFNLADRLILISRFRSEQEKQNSMDTDANDLKSSFAAFAFKKQTIEVPPIPQDYTREWPIQSFVDAIDDVKYADFLNLVASYRRDYSGTTWHGFWNHSGIQRE